MLHLTGDARDFNAIADRDRSLRQNHEATDEIARDILQAEPDAHAYCSGKNRERTEMDAGVLQDNNNADDQHDVADDLRNRVLQRAIEPALGEQPVKQKTLRARGNPEDRDQQRDEQENLEQAERDAGQRRIPRERDARGVDRVNREKDQRANT